MVQMEESGSCNIIHYGSTKEKRVTRSVPAAELFAMVQGFDVSTTIKLEINGVIGSNVPLQIYTDSRSLHESLVNINSTTEKLLLIDIHMLRQS